AAWVLLGVLVMCGGLALTEVIVLYPRAGGNYVFLREGYGRLWGFLWGWVDFFIVRSASIAALAAVFTESLHDVLRHEGVRATLGLPAAGPVIDFWPLQGVTVITIAVLALVNARGVRWGGGLQLVVTTVKVGSLLFIALLPFVLAFKSSGAADEPAHWNYLTAPPYKDLTWAGYLAEFARRLLGPLGGAVISGAIAISTFGALNGNLLVGPRLLFAMGRDGMAPRRLAAVHPRYHTPVVATLVLAVWSAALVLIGAGL